MINISRPRSAFSTKGWSFRQARAKSLKENSVVPPEIRDQRSAHLERRRLEDEQRAARERVEAARAALESARTRPSEADVLATAMGELSRLDAALKALGAVEEAPMVDAQSEPEASHDGDAGASEPPASKRKRSE